MEASIPQHLLDELDLLRRYNAEYAQLMASKYQDINYLNLEIERLQKMNAARVKLLNAQREKIIQLRGWLKDFLACHDELDIVTLASHPSTD